MRAAGLKHRHVFVFCSRPEWRAHTVDRGTTGAPRARGFRCGRAESAHSGRLKPSLRLQPRSSSPSFSSSVSAELSQLNLAHKGTRGGGGSGSLIPLSASPQSQPPFPSFVLPFASLCWWDKSGEGSCHRAPLPSSSSSSFSFPLFAIACN